MKFTPKVRQHYYLFIDVINFCVERINGDSINIEVLGFANELNIIGKDIASVKKHRYLN